MGQRGRHRPTLAACYAQLQATDSRWVTDFSDITLLINPNGPLLEAGTHGDNGQTGRKRVEAEARARIGHRDERDWPGLAAALLMNCPIWIEDQDFFGTGVPTWTTATVEIYLSSA